MSQGMLWHAGCVRCERGCAQLAASALCKAAPVGRLRSAAPHAGAGDGSCCRNPLPCVPPKPVTQLDSQLPAINLPAPAEDEDDEGQGATCMLRLRWAATTVASGGGEGLKCVAPTCLCHLPCPADDEDDSEEEEEEGDEEMGETQAAE